MDKTDILATLIKFYPLAPDCANGHLGPAIVYLEQEIDDDRCFAVRVTRCGHCNMPLEEE